MFEELIKEIKRAGTKWVLTDKVIELIKASEPPELDAPNEEGWWWLKNYAPYKIMCVEVFEYNGALYVALFSIQMHIEEFKGKGKWLRAIMPKGK
jgi:hypothetical protein